VRWEAYPPALRAIRIVGAIPAFLILLGLGFAYVVLGNTTGRLVGIALIVALIAILFVAVKRRRSACD